MVCVAAAAAAAAAEMKEKEAKRQPRLKQEVVVVDAVRRRQLVLHLSLIEPAMSCQERDAWERFSFLDVHLGDTRVVGFAPLPVQNWEVSGWRCSVKVPVAWDWPSLSLFLVVERSDYYADWDVVFRTEEPHTSHHSKVVCRAAVPLLDALAPWDESDDDSAADDPWVKDKKKRRLAEEKRKKPIEGTRVFQERIPLLHWQVPPPGAVDEETINVIRGYVTVSMHLTQE